LFSSQPAWNGTRAPIERLTPDQATEKPAEAEYRSIEEIKEDFRRRGIPIDRIFDTSDE
jgi:hypothetical protein